MDIPDIKQREEEGAKLRAYWDIHKKRTGETQEGICAKTGVNQGELQKYFKGKASIPENKLILLSIEMGFNPAELRPGLREKAAMLIAATRPDDMAALEYRLSKMSPKELREIEAFLDFLESKKQKLES
jgi:transcriptional regulator with XRE-family HTH domain